MKTSSAACVSFLAAAVFCGLAFVPAHSASAADEPWAARNAAVAKEQNVNIARPLPVDTAVAPSLEPGAVVKKDDLPAVVLAPGVVAKMYWGKGALVCWTTFAPGAAAPRETLPVERLMVVMKGSVEQLVGGSFSPMRAFDEKTNWSATPHRDVLYLAKGAASEVKAGPEGAEIVEIFQPVHPGLVKKAGGKLPAKLPAGVTLAEPTFAPGRISNFYDVQFSDLSQASSNSRLIDGRGVMASFLSCDPGRVSPFHAHPEEQLTIILRGHVNETVVDKKVTMNPGDIVYLPGNMVHRGEYDKEGCDMLDVFWPPRPDFLARIKERLDRFHALIPADAKVELVHDGATKEPLLNFTEGPVWLGGRLYFSNMWFAPDFSAGSPEKSNLIRVERDGKFTVLVSGLQTNGMMPLGNGNLVVCDMFGHRVVEMNPDGRILRTIADSFNGVAFDGPNDLVIDAKGGIYLSDPQFTPGLPKTQPGKSVFYIRPDGKVIRVVKPGDMGQPNGILLSPDGKTCFINNTRNMPVGNHLMAFDVQPDGSLANGREFGKLFLPPAVLDKADVASGADGMKIDVEGNLYVATTMGMQMFDTTGAYIGTVNVPVKPTSLAFGGDDMKTIYFASPTKIYKIRAKVAGLKYPLGK